MLVLPPVVESWCWTGAVGAAPSVVTCGCNWFRLSLQPLLLLLLQLMLTKMLVLAALLLPLMLPLRPLLLPLLLLLVAG